MDGFCMLSPWRDLPFDERVKVWLELAENGMTDGQATNDPQSDRSDLLHDVSSDRPAHSPLGGSGAERWMNCAGSVALLKHLGEDVSDEADYLIEGQAGHEAAADALTTGKDAWELVGETYHGIVMTPELADPLQIYLDYCRSLTGERYIEYPISSPVHPQFYGRLDFGAYAPEILEIVDLKMGVGIMVEVEENPQEGYYAFGLIDGFERRSRVPLPDDLKVRQTIVQPRGFYEDDPVRSWDTTVGAIKAWAKNELVPAMYATAYDHSLNVGEWCRFCPAKLVCPMLTALFQAAALANPQHIPDMSDKMIGENYSLAAGVKHYIRALELEAYNRAMRGREIPHGKLVHLKANRVWKEGAVALAQQRFGEDAYNPPEMKSPAQLEKLPAAREWVKEFSYTPSTGLRFTLTTSPGQAVTVTEPAKRFAAIKTEDW